MPEKINDKDIFKKCPLCSHIWVSREAFLSDSKISVIGYQVHFEELEAGLFYFNHDECGTTLALKAIVFKDLYDGPIFEERLTGSETCPGYCLKKSELRPCPNKCECAYVREILHIVKNWPKTS